MNPHHLPTMNPSSSLKSRFKRRFLQALIKVNRQRVLPPNLSSTSSREIFKRCRKVKIAADKSMAHAVGSSRAWSRAVLWKIRNQSRRRVALARRSRISSTPTTHGLMIRRRRNAIKEKMMMIKKRSVLEDDHHDDEANNIVFGSQEKKLKKLVPGGEGMDICSLLGETAHYIKCLNTQIQVMTSIVDHLYST